MATCTFLYVTRPHDKFGEIKIDKELSGFLIHSPSYASINSLANTGEHMGSVKKSVEYKVWWRRHSCKIFVCIYEFLILAGELSLETLLVVWVSAVSRHRELIALGKTPFGWGKSLRWNHLSYKIKARIDPFVFLVCARTWPYLEPWYGGPEACIWGAPLEVTTHPRFLLPPEYPAKLC